MTTQKTDRNPGIFLKTEFIPDKRIERRAIEELQSVGLMPDKPGPVAIDQFCDFKWGMPEDYKDLPPEVLGYAGFTHNGFDRIVINTALEGDLSQTARRRVRSTIAHEIGHAILHEKMFVEKMLYDQNQGLLFGEMERKPMMDVRKIVCREGDVFGGIGKSPWYEVQANKFMAAILMPKPLFYQVVEPFLLSYDDRTASPTMRMRYYGKIEEVSETFNVSREMARIAVENYMAKDRTKRAEGDLLWG